VEAIKREITAAKTKKQQLLRVQRLAKKKLKRKIDRNRERLREAVQLGIDEHAATTAKLDNVVISAISEAYDHVLRQVKTLANVTVETLQTDPQVKTTFAKIVAMKIATTEIIFEGTYHNQSAVGLARQTERTAIRQLRRFRTYRGIDGTYFIKKNPDPPDQRLARKIYGRDHDFVF
jgi:hypothetical protein